jgi:hypothetical protein
MLPLLYLSIPTILIEGDPSRNTGLSAVLSIIEGDPSNTRFSALFSSLYNTGRNRPLAKLVAENAPELRGSGVAAAAAAGALPPHA